ncbi:MAG: peptidoglycan DD-metalloendopeptidase family protein, partial [Syntrophaceticus sp.]|nr:peptidoglycan DD-metalloendopeptidase family protein [Syntrophaceticus sp.]
KDELSKVNSQIEERREQLNKNQEQQKDIVDQLDEIDQDIFKTSTDLERIDRELSALQVSIDELEPQLQEKEEALQERTDAYHQRLRNIYMQGNISYLEVLLDSTSMSDFLMRFDLLKKITDQDTKMVKELTEERDIVSRLKRELEEKREEVGVLQKTTEAKQTYLASRKQDRQDTLERLQSDQAACQRAIDELEATSQEITQFIQQYQSSNSSGSTGSSNSMPSRGNGRFSWPAAGPITSNYGMRWHPVYHVNKLHDGIDIGATYGSPIRAADGGTVIDVSLRSGYGNTVIIDHGGGITTLYAHMSSMAVRRGDVVSQGQIIGKVGGIPGTPGAGSSTGPHLHFGVRINGNPTNPLGYL